MTELDDEQLALQRYTNLMQMQGGIVLYQQALALDIFSILPDQGATVAKLASLCEVKPKPLAILLDGLCALGLLKKNQARYSQTSTAFMLSGKYQQLGMEYWQHLPTLLQLGEPMIAVDQAENSEAYYVDQALSLSLMMRPSAIECAQFLSQLSLPIAQVLELGAGSGVWGLALAEKIPALSLTLNDWPGVLAIAKAMADECGVDTRVKYLPGDYRQIDLGKGYDAVIVGNVIHLESEENMTSLLKVISSALRQNGYLIIIDVIKGSASNPLAESLYEMGLAIRTQQGHVYHAQELDILLTKSNFKLVEKQVLSAMPQMMTAWVAQKA